MYMGLFHKKPELNQPINKLRRTTCHMTDDTAAFIQAYESGDFETAIRIIDHGNLDYDYVSEYGDTLLIRAISNGRTEVSLALIATGLSKPCYVNTQYSVTALIMACFMGMSEVALALIATGQSNHTVNASIGYSALKYAECNRNMDHVVAKLLELAKD